MAFEIWPDDADLFCRIGVKAFVEKVSFLHILAWMPRDL